MTLWQPGMRMTASRLNDGIDPTVTTTGLVAATNFTVSSFSAKRSGKETWINLVVQYTGAGIGETAGGSGNISETLAATLPSGWRPPETASVLWRSTTNDGGGSIGTDGTITLSTTSGSAGIATNNSLRITTSWLNDT